MPEWLGLVGVVGSVIAIFLVIWRGGKGQGVLENDLAKVIEKQEKTEKALLELRKEVEALKIEVRELKIQFEPFWSLLKANLPKIFDYSHSPNLMQKLVDKTITQEELKEVECRLSKEVESRPMAVLMAKWMVELLKKENGWTQ
jgi:hypothetical protein